MNLPDHDTLELLIARTLEETGSTASLLDLLVQRDFAAFSHVAIRLLLGSAAPNRLLWHVEAMANVVTRLDRGDERRVLVCVPPRHLKSTVMTVAHTAWRLGRNPSLKVLLVSHSKALAEDLLGKIRSLIAHPWYRSAFPEVGEGLKINRADLLVTRWGGKVTASSFNAGFTGMGADVILIDDPLSAQAAFSERQRARCKRVFDEGLRSRLDDPARGAIVVVMQRLHEDDLIGHLKAQGGWHELKLPLVAEADQDIPLGETRSVTRAAGETIDPERVPLPLAEEIRRSVGSVVYQAQYQQDPQPAEGHLLRLGNVETYSERLSDYDEMVITVDTAIETGEANDYTACVVLGRSGHKIHVLQVERHRIPFIEQLMLVCDLAHEYRDAHVLVEAANSGIALIQELRRRHALHVTPVSARRSKEERAVSVAPLLENGDVYLPEQAAWLGAFTREVRVFPHGTHDDMVDAFVHGLAFLKRHIERGRERPLPAPRARLPERTRPRGNRRPLGAR